VLVTERLRATVLVIDDDQWIRSIIADALVAAGFRVEQAGDGATGLRMADELQSDVILLDLTLPMDSDLDVLQQLKDSRSTCEIPIIIVSDYAMLLIRDALIRAERALQTPFDIEELLERVNQVIRVAHPNLDLPSPTRELA